MMVYLICDTDGWPISVHSTEKLAQDALDIYKKCKHRPFWIYSKELDFIAIVKE
jgi:hypothetical protein